jgi:hypothetical protein
MKQASFRGDIVLIVDVWYVFFVVIVYCTACFTGCCGRLFAVDHGSQVMEFARSTTITKKWRHLWHILTLISKDIAVLAS